MYHGSPSRRRCNSENDGFQCLNLSDLYYILGSIQFQNTKTASVILVTLAVYFLFSRRAPLFGHHNSVNSAATLVRKKLLTRRQTGAIMTRSNCNCMETVA